MELARGLRPRQVYTTLVVAIVAFIAMNYQTSPADFWWHLARGRLIASHGPFYAPPEIGFTQPGVVFTNQAWLAQWLMYSLFRAGGRDLVLLVQGAIIGATYGLLYDLMRRRAEGRTRLAALVFLLGVVPLSYYNWEIRPQAYGLLLFVLVLRRVTAYRLRETTAAWPLVPIFVLWANLHGSFMLGIGLLGIVVLAEGVRCFLRPAAEPVGTVLTWPEWRSFTAWATVAVVGTCLNPHGPRVFEYALRVQRLLSTWNVCIEWLSPSPKTMVGALFAAGMIALFVLLALRKKRADATDLLMIVVFVWQALSATRSIVWFAIVAAPVAAEALASLVPGDTSKEETPELGGYFITGVTVLLTALALLYLRRLPTYQPYTTDTPIAAVAYLRELDDAHRPRRLFHGSGAGSYLLYAAPEQPVFIDARFELYTLSQWHDLQRLEAGIDVSKLEKEYKLDGFLLTQPSEQALIDALASDPAWSETFHDATSAVFLPSHARPVE